ncbi:peptidase [Shewanella sp. BF02_Schw]|uniref:S41 family peptidase n=1 Tax=Shewanella sp. BF02_Schw TaxID=394908 RepID=UPI0017828CE0|nr:S41 family peptidase [Shewanella sp. BF02_Schw]MBO1896312.1 peptidase [Shewanella sp. BF02_Schw]
MQLLFRKAITPLLVTASLTVAGCSGGGSESASNNVTPPVTDSSSITWTKGQFTPYADVALQCKADQTGSELTEKLWLRSWSNDTYLWYDEIFDRDPAPYTVAQYFDLLITDELSETGNVKDKFHFSMPTDEWEQLNQSGASFGYGFNLSLRNASAGVTRQVTITYSEPNSPAVAARINRGAIIVAVDGVNVANADDSASIDTLNAGLFPTQSGKQTTFTVRDLNAIVDRNVILSATTVISTPVQNTQVIQTASGKIGYLQFNSHIATAERGLFDAITTLSEADVEDLVLDLRYNGGGLLALASQLGYMIAGDTATNNRIFERTSFNDKYRTIDPVTRAILEPTPFIPQTIGFNTGLLRAGITLPSLNLKRLYVLTTADTCSASEALMNSLRGIDIEVIQIGGTTCGKPYGFYPTPNCGTTYFSIQFKGVNDKGFGDYSDGFVPTTSPTLDSEIEGCALSDDLNHALGDTNERLLSAALYYRDNNQCPELTSSAAKVSAAPTMMDKGFMLKDDRHSTLLKNNRIMSTGAM